MLKCRTSCVIDVNCFLNKLQTILKCFHLNVFKQVPIESDVGSGSGPSGAAAANRLVISRPTVIFLLHH